MRLSISLGLLLTGAIVLCPGCTQPYKRDVVRPDGELDLTKLKAKAETDGGKTQGAAWISLVLLEDTTFRKSALAPEEGRPDGYELRESWSYGPLFVHVADRSSYYDAELRGYEVNESLYLLLRLWSSHRSAVRTPHGTRVETSASILFGLLPIQWDTHYTSDSVELKGSDS